MRDPRGRPNISCYDIFMSITLSQYRALAEVRYRIRRFLVFSEARARVVGVEPQQHQLLLAVRGLPAGDEPTIGRVAERLQVQHHSAVELVNRSIEKGFVRKHPSPRDRRQVLVDITPKGRRVLEKLAALHRAELLSVAPALTGALGALVPSPAEVTP
jgi:DNA-binding MarR family transcriptional regulator